MPRFADSGTLNGRCERSRTGAAFAAIGTACIFRINERSINL